MARQSLAKGIVFCILTAFFWGAMFPVMGSALRHVDAFHLSLVRYVGVAVILSFILLIVEGKKAFRFEGQTLRLWWYGSLAVAGYSFLVFWSQHKMEQTGVILAAIMESMMPMMSVILLWLFKREAPGRGTLLCVAVAFVGVVLVVTQGDLGAFLLSGDQVIPAVVMFAGVMAWVVYTLGANDFAAWSPLRYSTLSALLGTCTSFGIVVLADGLGFLEAPSVRMYFDVLWEMAYMILFAGAAALLCWNAGIKLLKPINGMLFLNLVPVVTLVISALQGHAVTAYDMTGTGLIIAALVLNNIMQRRTGKRLPDQEQAEVRPSTSANSPV